jgi:hypothetical protein
LAELLADVGEVDLVEGVEDGLDGRGDAFGDAGEEVFGPLPLSFSMESSIFSKAAADAFHLARGVDVATEWRR